MESLTQIVQAVPRGTLQLVVEWAAVTLNSLRTTFEQRELLFALFDNTSP